MPEKFRGNEQLINSAALLLFVAEAERNPATIVTAPMIMDIITDEDRTDEQDSQIWSHMTGMFPMTPQYAMRLADGVNSSFVDDQGQMLFDDFVKKPDRKPAKSEDIEAAKDREVELAIRWMQTRLNPEETLFISRDEMRAFILEEIRKFYATDIEHMRKE